MNVDVDHEMQAEAPAGVEGSQIVARRTKIVFFGIFGIQNLGNECTLQAILYNFRRLQPDSDFSVISFNPADTAKRHQVPAIAVTQQNFANVKRRGGFWGNLARLVRICQRIPAELRDWLHAIQSLKGTDLVIMTGTGMLTDYMTAATGFPYDVFRWTVAARLAGCRVRFVGVGVGPIYGRVSRRLITTALSLADYRSFRDNNSRDRIRKNGFDSRKDPVYPDLAFGLDPRIFPERINRSLAIRRVGLGVMDHRDIHLWSAEEHAARYSTYLEAMCDFITWLLERDYTVRILQGDARHDAATRAELRSRLEKRGIRYDQAAIIDEGSTTVEELISQIAKVEILVSPRFHNLLLALMMKIPVVSISYDPKNDCLLDGFGLCDFHQPLFDLDLRRLIDQFTTLEMRTNELTPSFEQKLREYRNLLEEQYGVIFNIAGSLRSA